MIEGKQGFKGRFKIEHIRKGKVIEEFFADNGVTNEGKDSVLNVQFRAVTQITAWYTGIIDNSGYTALAAADTMASHGGWNEFTSYSQANRVTWTPAAPSAQAIVNSSAMVFDITGSGTLRGLFAVSNNTKGGTSGTLWATALFSSTVSVTSGDQIRVTYTVSAT